MNYRNRVEGMLSQGSSMGAGDRCQAIELSGEAVSPLSQGASLECFDPPECDQWASGRNVCKTDGLRILVVDGDATVRELMVQWLEEMGEDAIAVASGSEAVSNGEAGFDLVFIDLMMLRGSPGETLCNLKRVNKGIKAILLTAHLERGLMEAALEMGPVTILKKPLVKEVLQDLVASLSAHKSAQSPV